MDRLLRFALLLCLPLVVLGMPAAGFAGEVVLYSSNQPELIDMVSQGFEKKTGIKVSAVRLGTGEAMKRIQAVSWPPSSLVWVSATRRQSVPSAWRTFSTRSQSPGESDMNQSWLR